jgi:hypothetical protein
MDDPSSATNCLLSRFVSAVKQGSVDKYLSFSVGNVVHQIISMIYRLVLFPFGNSLIKASAILHDLQHLHIKFGLVSQRPIYFLVPFIHWMLSAFVAEFQ